MSPAPLSKVDSGCGFGSTRELSFRTDLVLGMVESEMVEQWSR